MAPRTRTRSSRWREASSQYNTKCEIDNPLAHFSPIRLEESAIAFATRINPVEPDVAFWKKAALVARYQQVPDLCENDRVIKGLTSVEKKAIRKQRDKGFWQQPRPLRVTIVTLCIAAVIQGWTQTGLNGANSIWAKQLHLTDRAGPPSTTREIWIFAAINAALYFSASILGCWASDPLQSLVLGRRGAIFSSACLCLAGAIGCSFSQTWHQLLGCRIVLGAAMGAKASVTPIYGAEVSPNHLRGALVMNWQLFTAFGIFLGFTSNLIVSQTGEDRWRYEVGSVVIPTLPLLSLVWTIPESPRWYLKRSRYKDAFKSFIALRETPLQAAAELFYANAQIQAEIKLLDRKVKRSDAEAADAEQHSNEKADLSTLHRLELAYIHHSENKDEDISRPPALPEALTILNGSVGYRPNREADEAVSACLPLPKRLKRAWDRAIDQENDLDLEAYQRCAKASFYVTRVYQLFSMPRIRNATVASLVMMIAQQMCGINILQFYSTTFFYDPKLNPDSLVGPGISLGFGLANFLFTFPIYGFIDTRGRRFLLLSSYPGMIVSMLGASLSYNLNHDTTRVIVVVMFMFLFVFFYSWGLGPVPFAYSSEVFPLLNREAGMSFAVFTNLFGAGVLALVVPQLTRTLANYRDATKSTTGESRLLGIFTGLNVIALILIFFLVPETAGATLGSSKTQGLNYISLEELNDIFKLKTTKHIEYQITIMVPWAWDMARWRFRKSILRKDEERPDDPYQLYTWVQIEKVKELSEGLNKPIDSESSH